MHVRNALRSKGVAIVCPMCDTDIEHVLHVFFDYKFAQQCSRLVDFDCYMWDVEDASVWLLDKLCSSSHNEIIKIATIL